MPLLNLTDTVLERSQLVTGGHQLALVVIRTARQSGQLEQAVEREAGA